MEEAQELVGVEEEDDEGSIMVQGGLLHAENTSDAEEERIEELVDKAALHPDENSAYAKAYRLYRTCHSLSVQDV